MLPWIAAGLAYLTLLWGKPVPFHSASRSQVMFALEIPLKPAPPQASLVHFDATLGISCSQHTFLRWTHMGWDPSRGACGCEPKAGFRTSVLHLCTWGWLLPFHWFGRLMEVEREACVSVASVLYPAPDTRYCGELCGCAG